MTFPIGSNLPETEDTLVYDFSAASDESEDSAISDDSGDDTSTDNSNDDESDDSDDSSSSSCFISSL